MRKLLIIISSICLFTSCSNNQTVVAKQKIKSEPTKHDIEDMFNVNSDAVARAINLESDESFKILSHTWDKVETIIDTTDGIKNDVIYYFIKVSAEGHETPEENNSSEEIKPNTIKKVENATVILECSKGVEDAEFLITDMKIRSLQDYQDNKYNHRK